MEQIFVNDYMSILDYNIRSKLPYYNCSIIVDNEGENIISKNLEIKGVDKNKTYTIKLYFNYFLKEIYKLNNNKIVFIFTDKYNFKRLVVFEDKKIIRNDIVDVQETRMNDIFNKNKYVKPPKTKGVLVKNVIVRKNGIEDFLENCRILAKDFDEKF